MPVGAPNILGKPAHRHGNLPQPEEGAEGRRPQHQCRRRGRLRPQPQEHRRGADLLMRGSRRWIVIPATMSCSRSTAPSASSTSRQRCAGRRRPDPRCRRHGPASTRTCATAIRSCRSRTAWRKGDWDGWKALTAPLGRKVQLVGDDLFVTNRTILEEGISKGIANALLVKVNQIGSLTRNIGGRRDGPSGRLRLRDVAPFGRDRRRDHRRPGGCDQLRADQDRLAVPVGSSCEIQPVAPDRTGLGRQRASPRTCRPESRSEITGRKQ